MKHTILILLILLGITTSVKASNDVIYQIQLVAKKGEIDMKPFEKLKDLGKIYKETIMLENPNKGYNRVYLGRYIGLTTAKKILARVKKRGFKSAFLESDGFTLTHSTGKHLKYSIQLIAYGRKIKMYKFETLEPVYLQYHKGTYRVLFGFYDELSAKNLESILADLGTKGFKSAYVRKFR